MFDWKDFADRRAQKRIFRGKPEVRDFEATKDIQVTWEPMIGHELAPIQIDILDPCLDGVRDAVTRLCLEFEAPPAESLAWTQGTPHMEDLLERALDGSLFPLLAQDTMRFRVAWEPRLGTRLPARVIDVGRAHPLFDPLLRAVETLVAEAVKDAAGKALVRQVAR